MRRRSSTRFGRIAKLSMAIVEKIRDDAPLSQGDILAGVTLFTTAAPWEGQGQAAKVPGDGICLVVSRPCNCEPGRNKKIVVVSVLKSTAINLPKDALKPVEPPKQSKDKAKNKDENKEAEPSARFHLALRF